MKNKIPVTLLSGFLGSGKTTLVNHIIDQSKDKKIALIENEFGEIGIDQELINYDDDLFVEMNNGCLCCSVKGDMVRILSKMLDSTSQIDQVLIESTGVADPGRVVEAFLAEGKLKESYYLDAVITIIDAQHFSKNLEMAKLEGNSFLKQLAFANIFLINKIDKVDQIQINEVKKKIISSNPDAKIYLTKNCEIDLNNIFGTSAFSMEKVRDQISQLPDDHSHGHGINSAALVVPGILNPTHLDMFLNYTYMQYKDRLMRAKGVLCLFGQEHKIYFQAVYDSFEFEEGPKWGSEQRHSKIVFIGDGLKSEVLQKGLENCLIKDEV